MNFHPKKEKKRERRNTRDKPNETRIHIGNKKKKRRKKPASSSLIFFDMYNIIHLPFSCIEMLPFVHFSFIIIYNLPHDISDASHYRFSCAACSCLCQALHCDHFRLTQCSVSLRFNCPWYLYGCFFLHFVWIGLVFWNKNIVSCVCVSWTNEWMNEWNVVCCSTENA